MCKLGNDNNRKVFLGLMGSMSLMTIGVVSLALFTAEEKTNLEKFSFSPLFSAVEARAAFAHNNALHKSQQYLEELSPQLPSVPEYELGDLVLEEVIPEEDPLNPGRTVLPTVDSRLYFSQPLAVHSSMKTLSLSDITRQKLEGGNVIEQLLEDEEAEFDEAAEIPWVEHKIAAGERLVDISHKYGILVATIAKVNSISNPDRLSPGQVLLIPRSEELLDEVLEERKSRVEEKLAAKKRADRVTYKNYTVKSGDSLWAIAHANNLTLDTLYGMNAMRSPDSLRPGTVLRIPNQDGLCVKIAKGQTLGAVAAKFGVSEKAVRMANGFNEKEQPKPGQEVFLPGASHSITAYKGSAGSGGISKKAPAVAKAPAGSAGYFAWPVPRNISSPFGWRTHPIQKKRLFHSGLDIRAPRNTPIRAARDGQVIFAGWMNGYGRSIVIRHDSAYTTLYTHAQSLRVKKGAYVKKGAIIATVGTSGRTTGPHTHFEVRYNNKPVNPMSYLQ